MEELSKDKIIVLNEISNGKKDELPSTEREPKSQVVIVTESYDPNTENSINQKKDTIQK